MRNRRAKMRSKKVYPRRASDFMAEWHSDIFDGRIRGNNIQQLWACLKMLLLSSPFGVGFLTSEDNLGGQLEKYRKALAAELVQETTIHLVLFYSVSAQRYRHTDCTLNHRPHTY